MVGLPSLENPLPMVDDVLNSTPLNVSFRRALVGNKLLEWQSLVARVAFINLNEGILSCRT